MGRTEDLIKESSSTSGVYKKLSPQGRVIFEQSVSELVSKTLSFGSFQTIRKHGVILAMEDSGAQELLNQMKKDLVGPLNSRAAAFSPALRNTARDVLLALADPQSSTTVTDIRNRRRS